MFSGTWHRRVAEEGPGKDAPALVEDFKRKCRELFQRYHAHARTNYHTIELDMEELMRPTLHRAARGRTFARNPRN